MNTWQLANQLKYLLGEAESPSGGDKVFGAVYVTARPRELPRGLGSRLPLAVINVGSADHDPEQPHLIDEQGWTVSVIVKNHGDAIGEGGILGANRSGGKTSSAGRGLLEVEERFFATLAQSFPVDGISSYAKVASSIDAAVDDVIGHVSWRQYRLVTLGLGTCRSYPGGARFAESGGTLSWENPAVRFDSESIVIRYDAGGTPPATVTSGTGVLDTTVLTTTSVASVGSGAYSLFHVYQDGGTTDEVSSLVSLIVP